MFFCSPERVSTTWYIFRVSYIMGIKLSLTRYMLNFAASSTDISNNVIDILLENYLLVHNNSIYTKT